MLPKICRQRWRGSPRAGLSARYVGAIERGDVSASVTVLGQIAEALGVEPGELLRRSSRKG
jgi:transcriptional regulator with XRE-family HTH domain